MRSVLVLLTGLMSLALPVSAGMATPADLSGTWVFSVELQDGGRGEPTFTFKQDGERLTGSYSGPLGEQKVTGTLKGNKAIFGFEFTNEGTPYEARYTGTVESATKMTGTVEFTNGVRGTWTATRKSEGISRP
jgi:hypothetical protein